MLDLLDVLMDREVLAKSTTVVLPNITKQIIGPELITARTSLQSQTLGIDAIEFGRLPAGIRTISGEFALAWNDQALRGTMSGNVLKRVDTIATQVAQQIPVQTIDREVVLLARWGHHTWGHWLGQALPLGAMIEARFPGRFVYAVAQERGNYGRRVMESLVAYGIGQDRVLQLIPARRWRFERAYIATSAWTNHAIHPDALDVMRSTVQATAGKGVSRIAILRRDSVKRGIVNGQEVADALLDAGFHITEMADTPFSDQVSIFREARELFSILGSGMTGLIYSPDGVRVITVRPEQWKDSFFYRLAQPRGGEWNELTGPSEPGCPAKDAAFRVDVSLLRTVLAARED